MINRQIDRHRKSDQLANSNSVDYNGSLKQITFLSNGRQVVFFYLTRLHTTTIILLSIFSLIEKIRRKIWGQLFKAKIQLILD